MDFLFTNHAIRRMSERDIVFPEKKDLRVAKGRCMKLIRKSCELNGYDNDFVYWRKNYKKLESTPVFVTKPFGVSKYIVITAFNLCLK